MLTLITCPTCHHKFTVPEGNMGQRSTCPNCQAIFVAGKSVAESTDRLNGRRGLLERAAADVQSGQSTQPPLDKTMLGEVEAPIRYNCPRCKKPLESPASEAGTKKPCPHCSGRLQVPAAPPRPAVDSGLNKTLLAESSGPVSAPSAASPAASPTPPIPSAINPEAEGKPTPSLLTGWRKYAIGGLAAVAVLLAVLYFNGKHNAGIEYEKMLQAQKHELDKLKADIEMKTALFQQQQQLEKQQQRQWEEQRAKQEERQRELERERKDELQRLALLNDQKQAAEAKAKLDQKQREMEEDRRMAEEKRIRTERETREQLEALKKQLDNANQRTTIIAQPPPVYPWWYYYGRYPW
jgi:DNA-directed RNA polymerase subunit RPC12/RpoP